MTPTLTLTVPGPALTGSCRRCGGNFEICTCTGGAVPQARTALPLRAGWYEDREEEDNQRGYERDETDQFHQVVQQLVDDGDARARSAGRQARRTLAEMLPGYVRQPVLRLTRPLPMRGAEEPCGLCEKWTCICPRWPGSAAVSSPAVVPGGYRAARNPEYACGSCGSWHAGSCPQTSGGPATTVLVR